MAFPLNLLNDFLELKRQGTQEKALDWVSLWEEWVEDGPAVLLESSGPVSDANRWVILAGKPTMEYYESQGQGWVKDPQGVKKVSFDFWDFADKIGRLQENFLPFPFNLSKAWFGSLSYEHAYNNPFLSRTSSRPFLSDVPDFYFFKPSSLIAFNRGTKEIYYFGNEDTRREPKETTTKAAFEVRTIKAECTFERYEVMVRRAKNYILQGDIYQANLAQAFRAQWKGSAANLYRTLRELNPGPFMGLLKGRNFTLVSSSPERLAAGQGNWLESRPIAGTRPRGKDETQDLQLRVELQTNAKEQAEHLMLVDLARNDLGRVSRYGTVEVKRYAEVEPYSKVQHLVSTVQSQRRESAKLSEVLQSVFPGGTITGCPKIRCMEIIRELEGSPRGYYTGSMGYLAPGPCFDLNILIRTFTLFSNGSLEFHAGAGIVADSDPQKEYMETLYKVEALAQSLGTSFLSAP